MSRIFAVILLGFLGCQMPQHLPCPTGFEVRFDTGEGHTAAFGQESSSSTGVSIYYDLTGECDAAR